MINLKKFIPVLAVVLILAAGAGGWYLLSRNGQPGLPQAQKTYTAKTLKAIIDMGVPMKCTYQVGDMEYEGYVKGEQWRGHMQFPDGKEGEIIVKDNCMWSWDSSKQGSKICFNPEAGEAEDESVWDNPETNTNTDISYTCFPAAVTDAKFNPPSDVQFTDLDQMMNDLPQMPEDMPEDMPDEMPQMPENMPDIPDSPEDFDMSRYQE